MVLADLSSTGEDRVLPAAQGTRWPEQCSGGGARAVVTAPCSSSSGILALVVPRELAHLAHLCSSEGDGSG